MNGNIKCGIYNRILSGNNKEYSIDTGYNLDES